MKYHHISHIEPILFINMMWNNLFQIGDFVLWKKMPGFENTSNFLVFMHILKYRGLLMGDVRPRRWMHLRNLIEYVGNILIFFLQVLHAPLFI